MWFPLSILEVDNEKIFAKYSVEWEPFDVDEYINEYCMKEIQRLAREKLEADKDVAAASMNAIGDVSNLMLGKMEASRRRRRRREAIANGTDPGGDDDDDDVEDVDQSLTIEADNVAVQMQNIDPNAEGAQAMGTDSGGASMDPSLFGDMGAEGGCAVGATVVVNKDNPFTFGNTSDSNVKTRVVSIDLSNPCTGQKAVVQNTSKPIEVEMEGNPDKIDCPMEFILCLSRKTTGVDPREYNYHPVQVDTNDSTIHFTIWPDREGDRFKVFLKYEDYPNATFYDHTTIIPHDKDAFQHIDPDKYPEKRRYLQHTYFPPQHLTKLNGTYRVAIKLHEKTTVNFEETKVCLNYSTQLMISGCKFWSEEDQTYKGDGLLVSNETTIWKTKCLSTHLTSFGGDFAVPPNTIDFSNVWAKFDLTSNAAVFSTVIALIGIYIIGIIWAQHMDKKDLLKWGATPLEDNLPTDNYHYQVTVQTGMKKKSGTSSKISFVMSGETNDSGARRLYDGHRKILPTGSILNYILSVERCLGPLSFLRIWHDNSGKGKMRSWKLDQIQVSDIQTGERYFFLCDRWLAVEEDDGMVDRIIPVAGREDLAAFKHLFTSSIRKKLTSDHLWFSIFSRPTRSNFTRVHRISCCMSLLFMTMISNAMFFKSEENGTQSNAMTIGPVSFTLQQVFVSFVSTMIVLPVNLIIITFFRRCRPKKNAIMQINQQMPKRGKWKNVTNTSQIWGNAPKRSKWQKFKDSIENITNFHQRSKYNAQDIDPEEEDKPMPKIVGMPEEKQAKKKKKPGTFPHWCIYIAYVLTVMSMIVPGFFTILYSMEWGPEKANEWLTTFIMSFFQSVIVVQPLKVMVLVAFIACIVKKPDIDEEDGASEDINNVIAAHDEEMLHKDHEELDAIVAKRKLANEDCKPIDMEALNKARENRMMEIKMETLLREIAIYLLFVLVLFFLSYQQRDSFSYQMAANLRNYFDNGFTSITTTEGYWKWMDKKLIPAMYASHYANGTEIIQWWDKRCTADMVSRRVGIPRLRQLRIKPDTCSVNQRLDSLINHCRNEYGWTDDDAKDYLPGWVKPHISNLSAVEESKTPWVYRSSFELANAPYLGEISTYKGGGYVAMFERNVERTNELIEHLRKEVWLDVYTRGVFLEFTVYNPNLNLFGSMIMLVEFMQSGGAVTRMEFKIFRLLSYIGGMGVVVMLFEVLYACFTLYFFVHFVKKLKKERKKYFNSFWNKLEFALMLFCVTVIAMYALKHILTSVAMNALKDRERADNVNFQSLAAYDELYSYMVGIVVFLATIQFLKLLQFNKKMNMLGDTVNLASKDLKVFSFAFIMYFLAFTIFGFLLFGSTLYAFASFVSAAESMFAFTLGSFDFAAMEASQKILGPIFFFLFIFIVYVGLMSIFLTIIADAFNTVKENVANQTNEYEIVDFMWKKIQGVIG
ncbi:polycystin-1-like protein 2 [Mytilus trossulus]|uniref:polycystin-1-like protein 2 n=1 Tax=Mytilus trossulus TaxID=6551 RepID=UPI003006F4CF